MPAATSEKLNQLRQQLQDCTNPKVAKLLKSAIAKLEAQLNPGQVQAKAAKAKPSKIAERKATLKKSQREANQIASRQQRTTLKPPSNKEVEPRPDATSQIGAATAPAQDKSQEFTDAAAQSEKPTTQDSTNPQTDASLQNKNPASAYQSLAKATPQQQQTAKTSETKSKQRNHRKQRQPLLPGNGTHRAWCLIPGIIRVREGDVEDEKEKSIYFVEVDGHPVKLFLSKKSFKRIKSLLDKPIMIFGYPNIMNGQITSLQLTGTSQRASEKTENFVLIGVWRADKQRVLIQRDQKRDPEIHIRQNSPLVSEDCLRELEDGKLYHFECQREGITVTIVGMEAVVSEGKNSNQTAP